MDSDSKSVDSDNRSRAAPENRDRAEEENLPNTRPTEKARKRALPRGPGSDLEQRNFGLTKSQSDVVTNVTQRYR